MKNKCPNCKGSGSAFANDPPTGFQCEDCSGTGFINPPSGQNRLIYIKGHKCYKCGGKGKIKLDI